MIKTVRVLNKKGTSLIVNEGLDSEFTTPSNYMYEFDIMDKQNTLYPKYEALVKWAMDGGKLIPYIESDVEKAKTLKKDLLIIHSSKVQQIQKVITNKTFTRELENEYSTKAVEAVKALESNDFSFFELSAQLKGMTSKQYAELVVAKSQQMHDVEKQALRKIGDIRSFISDLIDSKKFFQAQKMLDYIKEVKPELIIGVSNEQLVELIQTYSN